MRAYDLVLIPLNRVVLLNWKQEEINVCRMVLIPLNRVVLLNLRFKLLGGSHDRLNPLESGRVVKYQFRKKSMTSYIVS